MDKFELSKSRMEVVKEGFEYTTTRGDKVVLDYEDMYLIQDFLEFSNTGWYIAWLKYKVKANT
jgi:hypothetical protein